jgi:hypothetical protein
VKDTVILFGLVLFLAVVVAAIIWAAVYDVRYLVDAGVIPTLPDLERRTQ